jgi:hypothetical protein
MASADEDRTPAGLGSLRAELIDPMENENCHAGAARDAQTAGPNAFVKWAR